jgi:hypothetical protein
VDALLTVLSRHGSQNAQAETPSEPEPEPEPEADPARRST